MNLIRNGKMKQNKRNNNKGLFIMVLILLTISIVLLLLIPVLILLAQIHVTCTFTYVGEDPLLTIHISILRIPIMKRTINFSNLGEKSPLDHLHIGNFRTKGSYFIQSIKVIKQTFPSLLNNLSIHKFNWNTEGGTGEASSTGIAGGGVWAVKGGIIRYLAEKSHFKCQPNIHFQPHFQEECFRTSLECMVSIRLGKAIHAILNIRKKKGQAIQSKKQ